MGVNKTEIKILTGIDPKKYFPDPKLHIIVYAFSIGTYHYFRFDDPLHTPYARGLKTLVYYRELSMNIDPELLKAHTEAMDKILTQSSLNVSHLIQIKELNDLLKKRMELPKEPDLMYKYASVVFFDQFENPLDYEFKYGANKIKHWKQKTAMTDFFLQKPLLELIPYLQYAGENLEQFSQMTEQVTHQHLDKILPHLSEIQKIALLGNRTLSQAL